MKTSAIKNSPGAAATNADNMAARPPAGSHHAAGLESLPLDAPWSGPLAAAAWAGAIIGFWEEARARGEIDPEAPLDVLDLAPGRGLRPG